MPAPRGCCLYIISAPQNDPALPLSFLAASLNDFAEPLSHFPSSLNDFATSLYSSAETENHFAEPLNDFATSASDSPEPPNHFPASENHPLLLFFFTSKLFTFLSLPPQHHQVRYRFGRQVMSSSLIRVLSSLFPKLRVGHRRFCFAKQL